MSPKNDVSEERISQILDAAMETFTERGFHKTRMSDIAATSGLSKGTLYWYFESKDSIILRLLERVFEPELKDFRILLTEQQPAPERLLFYVERAGDDMIKMLKWMPLVYDFIALAFRQESISKAISKYYKQNLEILVTLIQQGVNAGELQVDNARDAAIAFGSLIEGTALLWLYAPDDIDIKSHLVSSANLLLSGMRPKARQEKGVPKLNQED